MSCTFNHDYLKLSQGILQEGCIVYIFEDSSKLASMFPKDMLEGLLYYYYLYTYLCVGGYVHVYKLWVLVLSFHHAGSGFQDSNSAARLDSKLLYPVNHLADSREEFK